MWFILRVLVLFSNDTECWLWNLTEQNVNPKQRIPFFSLVDLYCKGFIMQKKYIHLLLLLLHFEICSRNLIEICFVLLQMYPYIIFLILSSVTQSLKNWHFDFTETVCWPQMHYSHSLFFFFFPLVLLFNKAVEIPQETSFLLKICCPHAIYIRIVYIIVSQLCFMEGFILLIPYTGNAQFREFIM